jgi:hypothetical protein
MTIVASVKVRDGLALATDSMTQIHQGGQYRTSYANARKLFQILDLPVGVMSYGLGNIGDISVEGLVREFCAGLGASVKNVRTITDRLFAFIRVAYDSQFRGLPPEKCPVIGFFVAGYGGGGPFAEQSEFVIPRDPKPIQVTSNNVFGANWRGIELPFTRLYKGLDPRLVPQLQAKGFKDEEIVDLFTQVELPVIYDGMPVQDAINFTAYIVKTTMGFSAFEIGVPACGGPLQLAAILPSEGFRWIAFPDLGVQL